MEHIKWIIRQQRRRMISRSKSANGHSLLDMVHKDSGLEVDRGCATIYGTISRYSCEGGWTAVPTAAAWQEGELFQMLLQYLNPTL